LHGSRLQVFGVSNARLPADQRAEAMAGFIRVMLPGIVEGRIKPVVDKAFPFDQLAAAKDYVETNAQLGKVVVKMS
jgi:NADPH:quinone reductase-like Zn-dependent oxidoreductase